MGCILLYARAYDDRHLHTHLNGNCSRISSPSTHPAAAVHRQRPSPDRTKLRMTNTCEQTKHSIHGIQILFMWCQQTPLLDKHKLRSQALVDEFRQPPNIHNIGTYPPKNGHPGCDTTHRLTLVPGLFDIRTRRR